MPPPATCLSTREAPALRAADPQAAAAGGCGRATLPRRHPRPSPHDLDESSIIQTGGVAHVIPARQWILRSSRRILRSHPPVPASPDASSAPPKVLQMVYISSTSSPKYGTRRFSRCMQREGRCLRIAPPREGRVSGSCTGSNVGGFPGARRGRARPPVWFYQALNANRNGKESSGSCCRRTGNRRLPTSWQGGGAGRPLPGLHAVSRPDGGDGRAAQDGGFCRGGGAT